jgi:hypothetical protein
MELTYYLVSKSTCCQDADENKLKAAVRADVACDKYGMVPDRSYLDIVCIKII